MEPFCANCQNKFIPQFKYNKSIRRYEMCETCRTMETNIYIYVDCINYDKFNKLITDLHVSIAKVYKLQKL